MVRILSLNFREAINAQESGEVAIFLLTIDHVDLPEPIRLSTDPTERISDVPLHYRTFSNGESFTYLPMQVVIPDERENAPPRAQFRICNVTRELIEFIRSTTVPATAKLQLVLASDPDSVEVESPWLDIISVSNSARDLTFDMTLNSMATEQWPTDSMDPSTFPGLHAK
jgi:Domain of unknown function (DUF1833)